MAPLAYYRFWGGGTDRQSGDETETNTPNEWGYCGTSVNGNGVGSKWDANSNTSTGYPCLDGLGRGQTQQVLNGASSFPNRLNASTGTIAWPVQYLEPIYLWMNSYGSGTIQIRDTSTAANVDIFSENSSCAPNGCSSLTTGTGNGTLAQRPTSCAAGPGGTYYTSPTGSYGVAYWATDQETLYVCTATNTWTAIYSPYTYPHPLTAGGTTSTPPNAPQGLTVTVQ
jgi:hypothetical protein